MPYKFAINFVANTIRVDLHITIRVDLHVQSEWIYTYNQSGFTHHQSGFIRGHYSKLPRPGALLPATPSSPLIKACKPCASTKVAFMNLLLSSPTFANIHIRAYGLLLRRVMKLPLLKQNKILRCTYYYERERVMERLT